MRSGGASSKAKGDGQRTAKDLHFKYPIRFWYGDSTGTVGVRIRDVPWWQGTTDRIWGRSELLWGYFGDVPRGNFDYNRLRTAAGNICELPVGAACVVDTQFKGRGRSKNAWESPRGCLMFSFTLQMDDAKIVPVVQYVVSLAVTEAIKDVCHRNGFPCIDVTIKWPNDLYLNGLKVGGILCTSTYKSKKFNVSSGKETQSFSLTILQIQSDNVYFCLFV
ncbi:biotin--protein ligase 1, chloroplastic-like [Hibiscus syriacus]|uniref:biotin--protein ligase 1, chloroplastic-like n=1 Tax=Hibiscus syriacus TaxID=106335 RepID=UPI001924E80F|nr:biotin--protein ligase 1, chloroplastic-like [Hibiscus syriacus]